jgi:glucose-1-phosphate thymidylyltransferase
MKAIILAAGFAKRLYPLTKNFPKPLLKIKGKPLVDEIVKKIQEIKEVDQILLVTNNKFYDFFIDWKNEDNFIKIINDGVDEESKKRGAIGDLVFTLESEKIDEDILVIAGDAFFTFSLKEPYNLFKKSNKDLTVFQDLKDKDSAKDFGVAVISENKILDFQEKPLNPKSTICSVPIYFYRKETLKLIKEFDKKTSISDQPGLFLQDLYKRVPIYAYLAQGKWIDVGSKKSFEEANAY